MTGAKHTLHMLHHVKSWVGDDVKDVTRLNVFSCTVPIEQVMLQGS